MEEITQRVEKSAPVTHKLGNKRHLDLVFLVKNGTLIQVGVFEAELLGRQTHNTCKACFGTGKIRVPNICAYCDGNGCSHCKGTAAYSEVTCPEPKCKTNHRRKETHGKIRCNTRHKRPKGNPVHGR